MKSTWLAVGLMSGSSLDGVDLTAAEFRYNPNSGWTYSLLAAATLPYPQDWLSRLKGIEQMSAREFAQLDSDYGQWLGLSLRYWLVENNLKPEVVGVHGHTAFHTPHTQLSWQLGAGEALVSHLNCPVVTQFRAKDVALGGEGAPLVPAGEKALFPEYQAFLNLGGIANLSLFNPPEHVDQLSGQRHTGWKKRPLEVLAFDVAYCNQVLDALAAQAGHAYDPDGYLASQGQVTPELLERWRIWPYYYLPAPKSLDRDQLQEAFLDPLEQHPASIPDKMATWCLHLAQQVNQALDTYHPGVTEVLATGGGVLNRHLQRVLAETLAERNRELVVADKQLIQYKEALIFAWLGVQTVLGRHTTLYGATGARQPACTGSIHVPSTGGYSFGPQPTADAPPLAIDPASS